MKKIILITITTSFSVFCRGEVNLSTNAPLFSNFCVNQISPQYNLLTKSKKPFNSNGATYLNSNFQNCIHKSSDDIMSTHPLNCNTIYYEFPYRAKRTFQNTVELPKKSNHSIFLEIGGNSPFFSFNYEYKITQLKKGSIVSSIGVHHPAGLSLEERRFIKPNGDIERKRVLTNVIIPCRINWITHNESKHHAEIGVGLTYYSLPFATSSYDMIKEIYFGTRNKGFFLIPNTGYRFTGSKGAILRLTLTPYINQLTNPKVQLYGGISFGYQFRKKN